MSSETSSVALDTMMAYHRAWTGHDFEQAMTYVADDIVCDGPSGRLEGAEEFRGFMEPFTHILKASSVIAAYGDESTALLMYDTETIPVKSAPAAECVTVKDGRITKLRIIFDRAPFQAAEAAQAAAAAGGAS